MCFFFLQVVSLACNNRLVLFCCIKWIESIGNANQKKKKRWIIWEGKGKISGLAGLQQPTEKEKDVEQS